MATTLRREFAYELQAAVTPTRQQVLHDALEQLVKAGLLYRHRHPGGWRSCSVSPLPPIRPHCKHIRVNCFQKNRTDCMV